MKIFFIKLGHPYLLISLLMIFISACNSGEGNGNNNNIGTNDLAAANPGVNFSALFTGQVVTIVPPSSSDSAETFQKTSAKKIVLDNCSCDWSLSNEQSGFFYENDTCSANLRLTSQGPGEIFVQVQCPGEAPKSYGQNFTVTSPPSLNFTQQPFHSGSFGDTVGLVLEENDTEISLFGSVTQIDGDTFINILESQNAGASFTTKTVDDCSTFLCATRARIAMDANGVIYVVWSRGNPSGPSSIDSEDILFSKSVDGGISFSAPLQVSVDTCFNVDPAVATGSDGFVHVSWVCNNQVFYTTSNNSGNTFNPPIHFPTGTNLSNPVVAADTQGNVYVVWFDMLGGWYGNLFMMKSSNNGTNFSGPTRVNDVVDSVYSVNWGHQVKADDFGRVFAVWGDVRNYKPQTGDYSDLYGSLSTDFGITFANSVRISQTHNYNLYPGLAFDSFGNPHVCWDQFNVPFTTSGMMFSRSFNDGQTWDDELNLNSNTDQNNQACDLAVDSQNNVYVFWRIAEPVPGGVYFSSGITE